MIGFVAPTLEPQYTVVLVACVYWWVAPARDYLHRYMSRSKAEPGAIAAAAAAVIISTAAAAAAAVVIASTAASAAAATSSTPC